MFKECFIALLLAHIIGDFYAQTVIMAEKKEEEIKWVFIHCFSYYITMIVVSLPIASIYIIFAITVAAIFHTIIDVIKYLYKNKLKADDKLDINKIRDIFFVDQMLHIMTIAIISYVFYINNIPIRVNSFFAQFIDVLNMSKLSIASWFLALLIIHKPANIAISKLISKYKPEISQDEGVKDNNAGRFIGTIERIIILIFISIGQYSAIGLVLTAKSIARYDRISKEKDFAEYYLLGTLISTLVVIVISFLIK